MKINDKQNFGKKGEEIAVDFLREQGYKIIKRNYRTKIGEIDIIAKDSSYLCFIEVKIRSNLNKGFPQESVNKKKIRKISQIVLSYLKRYRVKDRDLRFDVVGILLKNENTEGNITLIKDAFYLDPNYFY